MYTYKILLFNVKTKGDNNCNPEDMAGTFRVKALIKDEQVATSFLQ